MVSHPIVAAATDVRARLKAVGQTNPTFMSTQEKADALRELVLALPKVVAATEGGVRTVIVRAPRLVNVVPA